MEIVDYKCVYFTFGRFQPPTVGHESNFKAVASKAGKCDYYIYLSQTQKKGTDPLSPDRKLYYAKKIFPKIAKQIRSGPRDPVGVLKELQTQGYDDVVLVVGSDRVQAMQWIKRYNGKDYTFRKMDIISSGERDADGDTFSISGTKMRRAAAAGDFDSFRAGIPKALGLKETRNLMDEIAELL
jgi:nicotinic acid mononucleotide adenylyltransferase